MANRSMAELEASAIAGIDSSACYRVAMPHVLIIEDDQRIRESLAMRLSDRGYSVETVASALPGVERAVSGEVDVVVLDLGLPDMDGGQALLMIRAVSSVPVVVATARSDERQIVDLLDAGADDYVIKPFSAEHLAARIRALLRRTGTDTEVRQLTLGELVLDLDARLATLAGEILTLKGKEFDVLVYLAERPGQVVRKRELLAAVWRQPYGGSDKTIDVHLSWLRKKLGETAAKPRYIHTERGVGVRLVDPDE